MTQAEAPAPNFVMVGVDLASDADFSVEYTVRKDPVTDAIEILSIDTPAKDIQSDQMQDFQRVFARQFGEF